MSNLVILEEGLTRMRLEEECSLEWLGTISIPIATSIDEINQTYLRKVAEREEDKGKAKITKEDVEIP